MIENDEKLPIKSESNVRVTEKYKYKCEYCSKKYVPKRRRKQKFCSNSCRSKNHRLKEITEKENKQLVEKVKTKIDTMSRAGVGNALVGSALVELGKSVFTSEENKAATKKDIKNLEKKIGRYHRILNMKPRLDGKTPYFDMATLKVVYRFWQ